MRTDIITKNPDGTVAYPEQHDYIMSQPYIHHDVPTTDPGFYHRHIISGGPTQWEATLAIDKFVEQVCSIPGYKLISKKEFHTPGNGQRSHGIEVLYAINGDYPPGTEGNRLRGAMLYPYQ